MRTNYESNYENNGTSKSKFITPAVLLSVIGGIIFWLSKRSDQSDSNDSQGVKEKAQQANEQIDKEELKDRFMRVVDLVKTTATSLQEIYDKHGEDLMEQTKQVKEQAENVASTAKEAGEDLKEIKDTTGQETKEELKGVKDAAKVDTGSSESNPEAVPFDQTIPPFRDPRK
ncbi:YtxH domain-containing protein [Alkalicoccus daliensis]|uniref:YtxH domain-containing protein n=1 Tax=Alkalicoccus daliensis TaxID=745820 RepID=A0A1G9ZA06_9BACI|nr:YtxH domain-containing protein [Alkalicoccus daliensis]SDN18209.1 hypothetical protein SAMN04488053_10119 [Alkalicoccus daliensis]